MKPNLRVVLRLGRLLYCFILLPSIIFAPAVDSFYLPCRVKSLQSLTAGCLSLRRFKNIYNRRLEMHIINFLGLGCKSGGFSTEFRLIDLIKYISQFLNGIKEEEVLAVLRTLMLQGKIPEYFQVVERDTAEPTGLLKQRGLVHHDGDWHLAVSVLIFDKKGNLLLQKRGPTIAEPGRWEVSASGHLAPGETPQEAVIREVEEEVGLKLNPQNLILIGRLNQFVKVGRYDVKEDRFEGDTYFHYSEDPSYNAERLSLFMYIVSDEEKKGIRAKEDVTEVKFVILSEELENFGKNPRDYSSAFAMYFSQKCVLRALYQNLQNMAYYEKK